MRNSPDSLDMSSEFGNVRRRAVVKFNQMSGEKLEMSGSAQYNFTYSAFHLFQVLFDSNGVLRKFDSVDQIFREFFHMRLEVYQKRKDYLEGMLSAESLRLDNIARFIMEKIDGTIVVGRYEGHALY